MRGGFLILGCIALTGCHALPAYMREVDPVRQLKAPADQALVVFVRPTTDEKDLPAHVMDESSSFLGTALPGGHFSVVRHVGKQQFIVFSGDLADALVADLAAGLVYFVELTPVTASGPPRFVFKASARGTHLFPYKKEWIDETAQFRVDGPAAKAAMGPEAETRREKVVKDANERLRKYAGVELTEHTLAQTDGHAAIGVPGTVRYATPAPAAVPIPTTVRNATPAPAPIAAPPPAPVQVSPGFMPEAFPSPPPPGPPPELLPEPGIRHGYMKGTLVRVKLKNGTLWLGEVVRETKVDLKISVGGATQLLDFEDMASVEELAHH